MESDKPKKIEGDPEGYEPRCGLPGASAAPAALYALALLTGGCHG